MDCEKLIFESREKYGETFSLYVFGQILTIVGKETTHEVLRKDQDFSFREGIKIQIPLHLIFKPATIPEKNDKIVKEHIAGKLKQLISRLQKNIIKAIDLHIGECVEPKIIHVRDPSKTFSEIIAIPIANIIVGEECYNNKEILEAFTDVSLSIIKMLFIPPVLSFIHPWLHQQLVTLPLRFGWNPFSKHKKAIIKHIKPVIKKRLYDKKRLGDAWVAPLDALQCYLDDPEITPDLDPNNVNYDYIASAIGRFIFSTMGTTNLGLTHALYDLAEKKQYRQELYQEAQEINKQYNGNELTSDDIARMVKLDSFVKESLRFSNGPIVGLLHKCISKSYYAFANGYQVPSGRIVYLNFVDTNNNEELQGQNPTEFDAYRHLKRNSSATKLERNFLVFGGGKHACPGRSFVINEIKMFLHKVMLKYDVRTDTEEIGPKRRYLGPFPAPLNVALVFENRKETVN
ncbi:24820_t:CDS:2 [Gigaspora margarita]|uniref:24820_t:CDS:1 n=1 Tax=Gigaspora margarita TaxID=4874 RepID=A0ABN7VF99_GIGMA|nr:24820_t:CDS:2 [Gigaspora margarita]